MKQGYHRSLISAARGGLMAIAITPLAPLAGHARPSGANVRHSDAMESKTALICVIKTIVVESYLFS